MFRLTLLEIFDIIGTVAFAISGAFVGIRKKMDIFGVNALAMTTACGGGVIRDIIIGSLPPRMFLNPLYALIAIIVANIVFIQVYRHKKLPRNMPVIYDKLLFWSDTLGLAAFTVDGFMIGVESGYGENVFLIVFLGFMTGVGGGALRDIMADQMPDIFVKHIYALASIAGGLLMAFLIFCTKSEQIAMVGAFALIVIVRNMAAIFEWDLPKVET